MALAIFIVTEKGKRMEQGEISLFYDPEDFDDIIFIGFEDAEWEYKEVFLYGFDPREHNPVVFEGLESVICLLKAHEMTTMKVDENFDPVRAGVLREKVQRRLSEEMSKGTPIESLPSLSEVDDWNENADFTIRRLGFIQNRIDDVRDLQTFFANKCVPTKEHLQEARGVLLAGLIQTFETYLLVDGDDHEENMRDALQPLTGCGSLYPFDFDEDFDESLDPEDACTWNF